MASSTTASLDDVLVVLEEISRSNRALMQENKHLKEHITQTEEKSRKALEDISSKLENSQDSTTTYPTSRKRRRQAAAKERRGNVSPQCRRVTKKAYQILVKKDDFPGFDLDDSFDSDGNTSVVDRVVTQLNHQYGGEDKRPWCRNDIEIVLKRYWLSLYEKSKKIKENKYEEHKRICRRNGRKADKLGRRTLSLENIGWNIHKKGEMAEVLTEDIMSSEESCMESDGEGRIRLKKYKVKHLPWESERLRKRKKALDKVYDKTLSKRAKDRVLPREVSDELSTRPMPNNLPEWAQDQSREA